jgi:ABC-type nitrate/sulfonate/bicarbonate transport system ATPase subunit
MVQDSLIEKIRVERLNKQFGSLPVLESVSLRAYPGELVTLVGPSGCGKSTIFNILAGLEKPGVGQFFYDGRQFLPATGKLAYMLQRDALLPWRTALDNAVLGLELAGKNRKAARKYAIELFEDFGLKGFEKSYPWELSGGMRQRVALLRTVLTDREVMLLDEPFGALDALTRTGLQEWLLEVQDKLKRTVLFITHDIEEALILSDRIYILSQRPAQVVLEQEVRLPPHRSATDPALVELKARLLSFLKREVEHAPDA